MGKKILIGIVEGLILLAVVLILLITSTTAGALVGGGFVPKADQVKNLALVLLGALLLRKFLTGKFLAGLLLLTPFRPYLASADNCCEKFVRNLTAPPRLKKWKWPLLLGFGLGFGVFLTLNHLFFRPAGLIGSYYDGTDWSGKPFLTINDQAINLQRMYRDFPGRTTNYSIRWTGLIDLPLTGAYEFVTASDDGSALYLDEQLLIDNGGRHGLQERAAFTQLPKGMHAITVVYFQETGTAALKVSWKKPGGTREDLSSASLLPARPGKVASFVKFTIALATLLCFVGLASVALLFAGNGQKSYAIVRSVVGAACIVVWGEWIILTQTGVRFATLTDEIVSWLVCFVVVSAASGIACKLKPVKMMVPYGLLLGFSFFIALGCFELALRTGWFDDWGTLWIQDKYRKINEDINKQNWEFANQNPYGFTDSVRAKQKPAGAYRIAVLGDSFVWGGSLPYTEAWGHKLERKITAQHPNIEVLNWGSSGWSTLNEMAFLETNGAQYDIDLLLVGFVRNDPDFGNYPWKLFDVKTLPQWYVRGLYYPLRTLFPNVFEFTTAYFNEFLMSYVLKDGYGWNVWYHKLYAVENLQRYLALLKEFAAYCQTQQIRLLFVLTPASYDQAEEQRLAAIAELLRQAQIEYLNLFPALVRDLSRYRPRQLWANLADGHPGPLMTELFANETLKYLEQKGIISGNK